MKNRQTIQDNGIEVEQRASTRQYESKDNYILKKTPFKITLKLEDKESAKLFMKIIKLIRDLNVSERKNPLLEDTKTHLKYLNCIISGKS